LLQRIIQKLEAGQLSPIDRLQLLNEQHILADVGIIKSTELLKLLQSYKNEDNESVWCIISSIIGLQKKFVDDDEVSEKKLREFVGKLAKKQYDRLGWDAKNGESEADTKLRSLILGLMLYSEDANVITKSIEIFHSAPIEQIDPEINHIVFSAAVRYENSADDINNLINVYAKTESSELQMSICGGLTSTRDEQLISRLLDLIKGGSVIRYQDSVRWLVHILRNKHGQKLAWQWIRENWAWIEEKFKGDKSYDEYPRYSAESLKTDEELREYREFFEPMKSDLALSRIIEMGINEIQNQIDLINRDGESVRQMLQNL
jgi:aminopeptidase N